MKLTNIMNNLYTTENDVTQFEFYQLFKIMDKKIKKIENFLDYNFFNLQNEFIDLELQENIESKGMGQCAVEYNHATMLLLFAQLKRSQERNKELPKSIQGENKFILDKKFLDLSSKHEGKFIVSFMTKQHSLTSRDVIFTLLSRDEIEIIHQSLNMNIDNCSYNVLSDYVGETIQVSSSDYFINLCNFDNDIDTQETNSITQNFCISKDGADTKRITSTLDDDYMYQFSNINGNVTCHELQVVLCEYYELAIDELLDKGFKNPYKIIRKDNVFYKETLIMNNGVIIDKTSTPLLSIANNDIIELVDDKIYLGDIIAVMESASYSNSNHYNKVPYYYTVHNISASICETKSFGSLVEDGYIIDNMDCL